MQPRQLTLQQHVIVRRTGDVACPARARADPVDRVFHGRAHLGVLAHAEIVVGAPHRDFVDVPVGGVAQRAWEVTDLTLQVSENTIVALVFEGVDALGKELLIIHGELG